MKEIKLSKGFFALVDDGDYEELMKYKWHTYFNGIYARAYRSEKRSKLKKNQGKIYMHRQIMGLTNEKLQVDHIDHNTLNNQRENLRICTAKQNQQNRKSHTNSASKYVGVYYEAKKWRARIRVDNKTLHLGRFDSEYDAAVARDVASRKYYGEFANINIK